MSASLTRLLADEKGVTAIEYGAIACFVGLVLVVAAGDVGLHARSVFRLVWWILGNHRSQLTH